MALATRHVPITRNVWGKYQYNLFRYLMVIGRQTEFDLMNALKDKGYENLSIPFANQMVLIARDHNGIRITELAALQGISKQLCYQSLRPIEQAGYIFREHDPRDGRAKLVKLTPIAKHMIDDALIELNAISTNFSNLIGIRKLKRLNRISARITPTMFYYGMNISQDSSQSNSIFAASAGQLSRHFESQLIKLNISRGHRELRPSFSQVLAYIDLQGSEISSIAELNRVSNQAITRIVTELEKLGYIARTSINPAQRAKTLVYTPLGLELVTDFVASVNTLEAELREQLGNKDFVAFCSLLKELYCKISGHHGLGNYDAKLIKIGDAAEAGQAPQNPVSLPELLLFIAAICEQQTPGQNGSPRLTRELQPTSGNKDLAMVFSQGSSRSLGDTAIQSERVLAQITQTIGERKTRGLMIALQQLATEFGSHC